MTVRDLVQPGEALTLTGEAYGPFPEGLWLDAAVDVVDGSADAQVAVGERLFPSLRQCGRGRLSWPSVRVVDPTESLASVLVAVSVSPSGDAPIIVEARRLSLSK